MSDQIQNTGSDKASIALNAVSLLMVALSAVTVDQWIKLLTIITLVFSIAYHVLGVSERVTALLKRKRGKK